MKLASTPARPRWSITWLCFTLAATPALPATATFYGVGQMPGGSLSTEIRDAVATSSSILAGGNAQVSPTSSLADTAVLWTPTGGFQSLGTLNNIAVPTSYRVVTASQVGDASNAVAARIDTDATGKNVLPALYTPAGPLAAVLAIPAGMRWGAATSVSSKGDTVFGFCVDTSGNLQGFSWTLAGGAVQIPAIAGYASLTPTGHGCSDDGTIAVGAANTASGATYAPGSAAFSYTPGASPTVLPLPLGGTWAGASGIDASGTYIVGCGDTPANPKGEVLLWTGGTVTALGVPASEAGTGIAESFAGVTKNGKVVVVAGVLGSYIHNASGWFDLAAALTDGGASLPGWSSLDVFGCSSDGTLVYGHGTHNGLIEGFVAQVASGYFEGYGKTKGKG